MKQFSDRRKSVERRHGQWPAVRRRAHDVVIWQEQRDQFEDQSWAVYDSVTDTVKHFEDEVAALTYFKKIKSTHSKAELV